MDGFLKVVRFHASPFSCDVVGMHTWSLNSFCFSNRGLVFGSTKMGAPKGSNDAREKSTMGADKEVQESTQEELYSGDAAAGLTNDQAQTKAAANEGGNIEVVLHEQVRVFVSETKTIIESAINEGQLEQVEEGEAGEEGDYEDADAEEADAGEQELAEEEERSGDLVDSQEGNEDEDDEEEDEDTKKRSLKQKWWDYMTT